MMRKPSTYLHLFDDVLEHLLLPLQAQDWGLHGLADKSAENDSEGAELETIDTWLAELSAAQHF